MRSAMPLILIDIRFIVGSNKERFSFRIMTLFIVFYR